MEQPDDDAQELIIDEAPPIHDIVMKVDQLRALPELEPGAHRYFGAKVVRPTKRPGGRDIVLIVDGKELVVLSFETRSAMDRCMTHLRGALQADEVCDDCGKSIVNAAYGLRSDPESRFCRDCADKRANIPRPL